MTRTPDDGSAPIGVVALGGPLPLAVVDVLAARGRPYFCVAVRGLTDPAIENHPHGWIRLFEIGRLARLLRGAGVRRLAFAGQIHRPDLRAIRLDLGALRALPLILAAARGGGDDSIVRRVSAAFEREGVEVVSLAEIAPELVAPTGVLGRVEPSERARADIELGFRILEATGSFDIGQAVVIHRLRVLALEAAEGTDATVARIADLRRAGRLPDAGGAGVLVKGPKPAQALRDDMPVVGERTLDAAIASRLEGVAVLAGGVILQGLPAIVERADRAGLFIVGVARSAVR
jgi:hypothetical protein